MRAGKIMPHFKENPGPCSKQQEVSVKENPETSTEPKKQKRVHGIEAEKKEETTYG